MSTPSMTISEFLNSSFKTFFVPPYQRDYSWDEKQFQELWDDIDSLRYDSGTVSNKHFMGLLVLIKRPET